MTKSASNRTRPTDSHAAPAFGFDLAVPMRAVLDSIRDDLRRRGLRLTLSTPARTLWIASDAVNFREAFEQRLADTLDGLPEGAALRVDVQCSGGFARVEIACGQGRVAARHDVLALPLAPAIDAARGVPTDPARSSPGSIAAGKLAGLRVLVADDIRDAARGLVALLRLAGAEAWPAFGGQAAIDDAQRLRPDAVVVDLDMPGVDGFEVARRIRRDEPGRAVRLIALTGTKRPEDMLRAREAGFDHHLAKPVDIASLTALLTATG